MADLLAFVLFAVAVSVTPGPNTVMLTTTADSHRLRAPAPWMPGACLGSTAMIAPVGLRPAGPLAAFPAQWRVLNAAMAALPALSALPPIAR